MGVLVCSGIGKKRGQGLRRKRIRQTEEETGEGAEKNEMRCRSEVHVDEEERSGRKIYRNSINQNR